MKVEDFDKEPFIFELPADVRFLTCCDCGLRHLLILEQRGNKIKLGFVIDEEGTKRERELTKVRKHGK